MHHEFRAHAGGSVNNPGGQELSTKVWSSLADVRTSIYAQRVCRCIDTGPPRDDIEPIETRIRIAFHDEPDGRTRLEIRQWLPAHLTGPSTQGWLEGLDKLDETLLNFLAAATDAES